MLSACSLQGEGGGGDSGVSCCLIPDCEFGSGRWWMYFGLLAVESVLFSLLCGVLVWVRSSSVTGVVTRLAAGAQDLRELAYRNFAKLTHPR